MSRTIRILAIEDEKPMLRVLSRTLGGRGFSVETFSDPVSALERLRLGGVDLVITDLMMPGVDGFTVIEEAVRSGDDVDVIVITAFSSVDSAVKAMKLGACDFIPKPFDPEHLLLVVERALEKKRLRSENIELRRELGARGFDDEIVGTSRAILDVKSLIDKVRRTDGTVLILGESGVGKELVARAIHSGSGRRERAFVPINCGALPDELLESELFGYEKGAFSGAVADKMGLLEAADGGTVFFDEVGRISEMMQVKLLRFLQDRSFMRLGGRELRQVDVRVIAATNEDLAAAIEEGRFREDLYYRLNVVPLDIPPLRDRREDIPLLIRHFLAVKAEKCGKPVPGVTKAAEKMLSSRSWSGNVRELENSIERAVTLAEGETLELGDFDGSGRPGSAAGDKGPPETGPLSLREVEAAHLVAVLESTGGNKRRAARILDIDYSTLLRKLKSIGYGKTP